MIGVISEEVVVDLGSGLWITVRQTQPANRPWERHGAGENDRAASWARIRVDEVCIRKDLRGRLRHVAYFLSDSMGFAVLHLISTLTKWGREYLPYEADTPE